MAQIHVGKKSGSVGRNMPYIYVAADVRAGTTTSTAITTSPTRKTLARGQDSQGMPAHWRRVAV